MNHGASPKVICFQYALPPNNIEISRVGKYPFVALLKAGIAVAFNNTFQLGNLDVKFKGPAVAIARVGLERGGLFSHSSYFETKSVILIF